MSEQPHNIYRKKPAIRIARHVAFWVAIVFYFGWGFGFNMNAKASLLNALSYVPGHMIMVYSLLYFLTPRYLVTKKYVQFTMGLVVVTLICAVYAGLANLTLAAFKQPFTGVSLDTGRNVLPFIHVGGLAFSIKFLNFWQKQKEETLEAQREQLITELELLRSQIHPHFLFNTLNNLYSYTLDRSDKAPEIVLKLSKLLRFMIYESKAAQIPLRNEIALLQAYIDLEQLRYGDRLDVSFACRGDIDGKQIAPLLLLPFLENAFKHGTSKQLDQCWLSFDLNVDGPALQFKLVNSIDKEDEKLTVKAGGLGLQNVRRRLDLLYKGNYRLDVQHEDEVFIVSLQLQLALVQEEDMTTLLSTQTIGNKYDLEMPGRR
jgi:hypothetical protein